MPILVEANLNARCRLISCGRASASATGVRIAEGKSNPK
jgi:hypothetical protein